jgi:ParB family transcriptional regulator, chromosome partitioning protein
MQAREIGLSSVPVYVLPADASDAETATVDRIVQQMVANDQRQSLSNSQRARAIQQILDTGMSATKVAKLSMHREDVKAAGAATNSATALSALDDGQLDFTQAEVLSEFEDDEDAVERLLRAARYGGNNFEHTVSTLRAQREINALIEVAEKEYTGRGYAILPDRPSWSDLAAVSLEYLRTGEDAEVPSDFEKKPEHWAVYLTEDYAYVDAETGEPVDDSELDPDTTAAAAGIQLALDPRGTVPQQSGFLADGRVSVAINGDEVHTPGTRRCIANSVQAGIDVRRKARR